VHRVRGQPSTTDTLRGRAQDTTLSLIQLNLLPKHLSLLARDITAPNNPPDTLLNLHMRQQAGHDLPRSAADTLRPLLEPFRRNQMQRDEQKHGSNLGLLPQREALESRRTHRGDLGQIHIRRRHQLRHPA
jgi:hypothetical protein